MREKNLAAFMEGSHAVNEEGRPLVLYHGTADDFDEFRHFQANKKDKGWLGRGFYFTNSRPLARSYSLLKAGKEEPRVMEVHLSLKNPFYATKEHREALRWALEQNPHAADDFRNQLLDAGHDGVIFDHGGPDQVKEYVALHPEQIKSATDNNGDFDPSNPNITKADGGEVERNFSPVPGLEAYHEDPAFQEWFGNSVTHREGVPVTYYTGTSKDVDFNKFNVGRHGAWFTADPAEASEYAEQNDSMGYKRDGWKMVKTNTASRVIPAHLKIENPYTGPRPDWVMASDNYKKAQSDWFDTLRMKGHDGWIPEQFGGQLAVVLKEPHQIKSVNNRTWDPKNPRMDKAGGGEVDDEGIAAYHGSPHDFDQFLMDRIGTGEGAQAYGHGLYFAENEDVARGYRNRVTKQQASNPDFYEGMEFPPSPSRDELNELSALGMKMRQEGNLPPHELARWREIKNVQDQYDRAVEAAKPKGRMYEVRINAHPDHFLDWDKPLSEQSQHVQDILNSHPKAARLLGNDVVKGELSEPTGQSILNRLFGSPSEKSEHLRNLGIKGIRYLDAGSRGAGEGTRNYVVFDDKLVDVKKKYADGGVVEEASGSAEPPKQPAKRKGRASSVIVGERSPIVDRALMLVSRKA